MDKANNKQGREKKGCGQINLAEKRHRKTYNFLSTDGAVGTAGPINIRPITLNFERNSGSGKIHKAFEQCLCCLPETGIVRTICIARSLAATQLVFGCCLILEFSYLCCYYLNEHLLLPTLGSSVCAGFLSLVCGILGLSLTHQPSTLWPAALHLILSGINAPINGIHAVLLATAGHVPETRGSQWLTPNDLKFFYLFGVVPCANMVITIVAALPGCLSCCGSHEDDPQFHPVYPSPRNKNQLYKNMRLAQLHLQQTMESVVMIETETPE